MKGILSIIILALVGLVLGCGAPTFTAAEMAYMNALDEHHERMLEEGFKGLVMALTLAEVLEGESDVDLDEWREKAKAHYDSLIYLGLEGMDKNTRDHVLGLGLFAVPAKEKYLVPPRTMAHIQTEYTEAMLRYTEGALNFRSAVLLTRFAGQDEAVAMYTMSGIESFESGDLHITQTQHLLDRFQQSGSRRALDSALTVAVGILPLAIIAGLVVFIRGMVQRRRRRSES